MVNTTHSKLVNVFYNTHPISESQVLDKLAQTGADTSILTVELLQHHDQDHFGGLAATDALALHAKINESTHVLDLCCGLGGPARYLAYHYGCRVTGVDMNTDRLAGAVRLTERTKLQDRVLFHHANALQTGLADETFDVIVSQEAFCHIPNKKTLITECVRLLKPGGRIVYTDILARSNMTNEIRSRLETEMVFSELSTLEQYCHLLEEKGCQVIEVEDLSDNWAEILIDRLTMYRSLKEQTVSSFDLAHFQKWDRTYSFFVGLYRSGELGGGRFVAHKPKSI
ncbi:MAG: methyltransferase domain-containing protein [Pseudomonadota bacterium]|nr:methyltransferase domain-containing protein [Pseudomonadota bacterium]MEC8962464.1 methyltransferase domain-containing protein [Pseudomonadota bacterium]MED5390877.1 methyltransferase domain-containing protein [Pseudomonadota bacterium]MEE3282067.1 methyltransferase domain-containing protein [Pseudomonadota bacterium]